MASNFDRVLEWVEIFVNRRLPDLTNAIRALSERRDQTEIGLRISLVRGRKCTVANIDRGETQLMDTDGTILSIAAKNADGDVFGFPADQYSWDSSNNAIAELALQTPHADDRELTEYERWAGTPPGSSGSAVITVTHTPTGNTETATLKVRKTGPGEIGLSVGAAVPEPTEAPPA